MIRTVVARPLQEKRSCSMLEYGNTRRLATRLEEMERKRSILAKPGARDAANAPTMRHVETGSDATGSDATRSHASKSERLPRSPEPVARDPVARDPVARDPVGQTDDPPATSPPPSSTRI